MTYSSAPLPSLNCELFLSFQMLVCDAELVELHCGPGHPRPISCERLASSLS
jgi:hypothetical protein